MRIRLTHRTHILDVMTHNSIRYTEVGSRAIGKMAHDHRGRFASMFIHYHNICKVIGTASLHQLDEIYSPNLPRPTWKLHG